MRTFEDKTFVYKKLNSSEEVLLKLKTRSPALSADIRKLTDLHDDVELIIEDDKRTYSLIIGEGIREA